MYSDLYDPSIGQLYTCIAHATCPPTRLTTEPKRRHKEKSVLKVIVALILMSESDVSGPFFALLPMILHVP